MLQQLTIQNYALIQSLQIDFDKGFTVITGETGSGKSIILGALGLLLGQRADIQVLLDKTRKCVVEGMFNIKELNLEPFFSTNDWDYDDMLLLRREIQPSGKSRIFVNDTPTSLQLVKELGTHIIDIHSQHQTLTLTDADFQLQLLDVLSENTEWIKKYKVEYTIYISMKMEMRRLLEQDAQNKKELDYDQFLFQELQEAHLLENEQELLEQELQILTHSETIKQVFSSVIAYCDEQEDATIPRLSTCKLLLSKIMGYHTGVEELYKRLDSCIIELRDILSEIESMDNSIQYSTQRQEEISQRLDIMYRLYNKHGVSNIGELLQIQNQLDEKLQSVFGLDNAIEKLRLELSATEKRLQYLSSQLTSMRKVAISKLEQQIKPVLFDLGMKEAVLQVHLESSDHFLSTGSDVVRFLFNANKGGELREIGKVISGGELSRLMLAIKSLITQNTLLPTIIFDEIDTGVSGEISGKVGSIMQRISESTQVLAITHLPQIAAKAATHLVVYKQTEQDRTLSYMRELTGEQRIEEIAKMLSSNNITESALATARELMEN